MKVEGNAVMQEVTAWLPDEDAGTGSVEDVLVVRDTLDVINMVEQEGVVDLVEVEDLDEMEDLENAQGLGDSEGSGAERPAGVARRPSKASQAAERPNPIVEGDPEGSGREGSQAMPQGFNTLVDLCGIFKKSTISEVGGPNTACGPCLCPQHRP